MKLKLLLIAAFGILLSNSCKKDFRNPLHGSDKLLIGAYLTLLETENVNLDPTNLSASVGIKVGSVGAPIDVINLYVSDDATADQTWQLVKTIPYTGEGTEVAATGNEIAAALGYSADQFLPGTNLTMHNQVVTTDGHTYDITNAALNVGAPDFNAIFDWTVYILCPPFAGGMAGTYEVIEDGWADWAPGTILPDVVADGPGVNQITLYVYPNPDYGDPINPIIVDIDPITGAATVPKVLYGDYGVLISAEGSGVVFSCTGYISLDLNHTADNGATDYGVYKIILQKQ